MLISARKEWKKLKKLYTRSPKKLQKLFTHYTLTFCQTNNEFVLFDDDRIDFILIILFFLVVIAISKNYSTY